jgi:hypothetical protein
VKTQVASIIAVALFSSAASAEIQSREALEEFFRSSDGSRSLHATRETVEICSDWCQRYKSSRGITSAQAWDLIFLHEYYYIGRGPVEEFRAKYASLADSLMSKYGKLCPRADSLSRPGCVIGYLGLRNQVQFADVFEKDGQRCEVWTHLVHSKTIYRSSCRKVEHAS